MNTEILTNIVITDIISVSTLYTPEGISKRRENRDKWAIIVKYEGETVYTIEGKKHLSNSTHVNILPKGCSYDWKCTKAGHYIAIEFNSPSESRELLTFSVSSSEKLIKQIKKLELEKTLKGDYSRLECIKGIYDIILTLLNSAPPKYTTTTKHKKIAPALDYIAQNYNQKLENDKLAALCGISTVYFRKLFTEVMKKTPTEYIQSLKIEKAKEMLISDYGSIGDIAGELGYLNIYDFSRTFKRIVGVSPKNFRVSI